MITNIYSEIWIIALEVFNSIAERSKVTFLLKPFGKISIKHNFKYTDKYRDYIFIPLNLSTKRIKRKLKAIENYKPLTFCINDYRKVENNNYQLIRNFLSEFYNNKSEFKK